MRPACFLMVLLMATGLLGTARGKPDERIPEGRKEREKKVEELNREGSQKIEGHDFAGARELFEQALEIGRALYPRSEFPNGHPELAASIQNVGLMHLLAEEFADAEPLLWEALRMNRALFPREKYPQGHLHLAANVLWLGQLYGNLADYSRAEPLCREGLAMRRALYPPKDFPQGHPGLYEAVVLLAELYREAGEYAKAEPLCRECVEMARALYPRKGDRVGQLVIAAAQANLAYLYQQAGEYGKAEALYTEAVQAARARFPKDEYPQGHRDLAQAISALAELHWIAGEYAKARPLYDEALRMGRAVLPTSRFPTRHIDLAILLNGAALLHRSLGEYDQAEALDRESLGIIRAAYTKEKYPHGHPDLARCINNLAALYREVGEYGRAEPLFREALDVHRALYPPEKYPHGHPNLALSILNLASLHLASGQYAAAEPLCREALGMHQRLLREYAELAAEAQCLNYVARQPPALDVFLSVTRHLPGQSVYDAVWDSRAALTRLQERRHHDLMASHDRETAELARQLHVTRLTLSRRLLNPLPDADRQRAEVQKLTDAKEDLEKRIAGVLRLAPASARTATSPQRLADSLPAGTAFVDLYRYTDFEQAPGIKGHKGERQTPRYVAFLVRRDRPVARVELNEAAPVEAAWAAWRTAIMAAQPDEQAERAAARALAKLVWDPLRKELPSPIKTVYLAPAGLLHQVPWGALPGRETDTVLLDEFAVCLVPHGHFLQGQLEGPGDAHRPGAALVAYGGVDYDNGPAVSARSPEDVGGPLLSEKKRLRWHGLPGTAREQEQVVALATKVLRDRPISRTGRDASTKQLEEDLPRARYAHLATHGFFAGREFRSAFQADAGTFRRVSRDRRGGARSPLVLSGLVLAGANRMGKDMAEDRGILTAEGIIGLPLEDLELAVLSACETGLGEEGGGEGVYGLQRAFHVAGCKSVVASLWKVDDRATQALMVLFYRNLWEGKLDAAEALRQAQRTLYRHPETVQVAQKRGFDFTERDLPKDAIEAGPRPRRSPTAQWAAFTFSGTRPAR